MVRKLLILTRNNFLLEFRLREVAFVLISLCLLLTTVLGFGLGSAFLDPQVRIKLFPALLWVVMILAATIAVGRGFEYDLEHSAIDRLILLQVSPALIFLAKCLTNFVVLCISFLCASIGLIVLLAIPLYSQLAQILFAGMPVLSALALLATLLSAITVRAKIKQVLLPLILVPLLFPLLAAAVELSAAAAGMPGQGASADWWWLLLGLNLLYLLLGITLFKFIIID